MYSFNLEAMINTSLVETEEAEVVVPPALEMPEAEAERTSVGALASIAAASLWRAPGKWISKQETLQKTYPVRCPLQVETLQT